MWAGCFHPSAAVSPLRCRRDPAAHSGWSRTPRASTPGPARRVELGCSPTCRRHSCLAGRREHPTTDGATREHTEEEFMVAPGDQQARYTFSLFHCLEIRIPRRYSSYSSVQNQEYLPVSYKTPRLSRSCSHRCFLRDSKWFGNPDIWL